MRHTRRRPGTAASTLPLLLCVAALTACSAHVSDANVADPQADAWDGLSADDGGPADLPPACDSDPPDRIWLTINGLPEAMLGLKPGRWKGKSSPFHWAVPPTEWTLELMVEHGPQWCATGAPVLSWGPIDGAGPAPLGELAPAGEWQATDSGHRWQAVVLTALPGGLGIQGLSASYGGLHTPVVPVEVAERTEDIDPFESVDRWAITFSRDRGDLSVTFKDGKFDVRTAGAPAPDGEADFIEALAALGFLGGDQAFNAAMVSWLRAHMLALMREFYLLQVSDGAIGPESVRVQIVFEGDPALPEAGKRAEQGWSQMAVGGEDPNWKPGGPTFFGRAQVDWHNSKANDNTQPNLGVFTTAVVRMVLTNSAGAALLKGYAPASGGKPFGSVTGDSAFLQPGFDAEALPPGEQRSRGLQFKLVGELLGLALASVTAHEMGHSLGLVRAGLPPQGMLADVAGPWAVQKVPGGHVDTPGFNLMQTGSSFSFGDLLSGPPRFAASNLGYLRRRLLMLK